MQVAVGSSKFVIITSWTVDSACDLCLNWCRNILSKLVSCHINGSRCLIVGNVLDKQVKSNGAASSSVSELWSRLGWSQSLLSSASGLFVTIQSRAVFLSLSVSFSVSSPLPSNRHHRSCGDRLEGKGENYQVCSVQYCVQQLCTVRCTHIWTD